MSNQEAGDFGLIGKLINSTLVLAGLWALTLMWLLLGGCAACVFMVGSPWLLPIGGLAVAGVLLVWALLLRWGLRQHLPGSFRQWGWQAAIYSGFILSQLATGWWLLQHAFDGIPGMWTN